MINGTNENTKVMPRRKTNLELRDREYLTPQEMEQLLAVTKKLGRQGFRNYCMLFLGYRHGLRNTELCNLKWSDIDLGAGTILVRRLKGSESGIHPLGREEIRVLLKLRKQYPEGQYVFQLQNGAPMTETCFRQIVKRAGIAAGLPFPIHPHMLRHSCGFYLIQKADFRSVQQWLGHRQMQSTVRYTVLTPDRFRGLWD